MAVSKIGLRRAWFQVHKWIGLLLAVLIIPLSLSGAALVWHDALDKVVNPQRHALTSATVRLPVPAYAAAAQAVLAPGERIASVTIEPGEPVTAMAMRPLPKGIDGRPSRTMIWLDPGSARVLDKADSQAGLLRTIHLLHGGMLVPGVGRTIVGWLGVAMLLSSLTGLWLWWPTVGNWARGLRWRRHRNFDTNLHHLFGFWISLPLFVLSLTGAWISFPTFFAGLSGGKAAQGQGGGGRAARLRALPLETPTLTPAAAIASAQAQAPGAVTALAWPTDRKAEWSVTLRPARGKPATVAVEDASGAARIARDASVGEGRGQAGLARLMRRIHDGTGMGPIWQTIIFLGGLLPAALAVTGIIMWWRARAWRGA